MLNKAWETGRWEWGEGGVKGSLTGWLSCVLANGWTGYSADSPLWLWRSTFHCSRFNYFYPEAAELSLKQISTVPTDVRSTLGLNSQEHYEYHYKNIRARKIEFNVRTAWVQVYCLTTVTMKVTSYQRHNVLICSFIHITSKEWYIWSVSV